MSKYLLMICAIFTFGILSSQTTNNLSSEFVKVEKYQLSNGLTVVLSENHDKPTVTGAVIVKAGSKNDPADATGMAHYLEHMLFKGTQELGTINYEEEKVYLDQIDSLYEVLGKTSDEEQRKIIQKQINESSKLAGQFAIPNELDQMLSEIGSKGVNAFTSPDITAYHNEFPSNKMEEWLSIYSHRFENPVFRLFQSELETVYEEKNRSEESFISHAVEVFLKNFYKKHPYGTQTTIGTTEHLKNPSLMKMYEFFDTYYVANNMILCLAGDFNSDEVKSLIEHYFSGWRTGEVPEFPEYVEEDFNEGESIVISVSPVKAFIRGYRTPQFGTYDHIVMEIVTNILSNSQNSGLLDKLMNEGNFMALHTENISFQDYGTTIFLCVPKILSQSFDKANKTIDETLAKLTTGDFDDLLFEGARNEWIKDFETDMESNGDRLFLIGQVLGYGIDWATYLNYVEKIKALNKNELVEIANRYFSKNNYTLYSKIGRYKPEKLDKPDYDPIIPNNETNSQFYNAWKEIKTNPSSPELVSLKEKIEFDNLSSGAELKMVQNPINDVFDLEIVWEVGQYEKPHLLLLQRLLNTSSIKGESLYEFRNKLYALGTSIHWQLSDYEFTLAVEGLDENLEESLNLIGTMLKQPTLEDFKKKVKVYAKQLKMNRRFETRDVQSLNKILREYALHGEFSKYVRQVPSKAFKKLKEDDYGNLLTSLYEYRYHVNYSGNVEKEILKNALEKLNIKSGTKTNFDFVLPLSKNDNDGFFIKNKASIQTHIGFVGINKNIDNDPILVRNAFNYYFGLDMSSLLFQEIREFRSLAYSTYGLMTDQRSLKTPNTFISYVGCQGDKTQESLELLNSLIKEMPIKRGRDNIIVSSTKNIIENSNPGFREYNALYEKSVLLGKDDNYFISLKEELPSLTFDDVIDYYKNNVQNMPLKLTIIGNPKKFKKKILKDYGDIKRVKRKTIYRL